MKNYVINLNIVLVPKAGVIYLIKFLKPKGVPKKKKEKLFQSSGSTVRPIRHHGLPTYPIQVGICSSIPKFGRIIRFPSEDTEQEILQSRERLTEQGARCELGNHAKT